MAGGLLLAKLIGRILPSIVTTAANVLNPLTLRPEKIETGSPVFAPWQVQTDEKAKNQ
jgi:hypothetical protein